MLDTKSYFNEAKKALAKMKEHDEEVIKEAAVLMGDCMNRNGVVQLFGLDSGRAFSMELGFRAGGLMPFHQFITKDLAMRGAISEEEFLKPDFNDDLSMAHKLFELYRIEKEDMFVMISANGCEAIMVEAAKIAKENAYTIIAVVSKKAEEASVSRHPSGLKLSDFADLVIDTYTEAVDAVLDVDGVHKMNQVNTIVGNVIAQMITAETYNYLINNGYDCPVLLSMNVTGADVKNRVLQNKYDGRWNA